MSRSRALAPIACLLLAGPALAAEFKPMDYAYRAPLFVNGRAALNLVPLPAEVYRVSTRTDLGDVVVVNNLDEVVPFAVRRPAPPPEPTAASVPLPLFPLTSPGNLPGEALRLRLRSGSTSVDIDQPAAPSGARPPAAYLLDLRGLAEPLTRLRLSWPDDAPDFSARLSVDTSTDLVRWVPVAGIAAVAHLHYAGQAFERADIELPGVRGQFLRIAWQGVAPVVLTAASGEHRVRRPESVRLQAQAAGTPAGTGEFDYDVGARLPLDRVSLALPEQNTVVDVEFLAQLADTGDWRSVARGRIYRLAVAGESDLVNPPLEIKATPARHWKVRVAAAGGGVGHGAPSLEGGWLPDELVFVARGAPPFRLLYGNAAATPLAVDAATLVDLSGALRTAGRPLEPVRAVLGPPAELGGPDRLVPQVPPPDWKRWLLWGVLVLGVAMLARMAYRLAKNL